MLSSSSSRRHKGMIVCDMDIDDVDEEKSNNNYLSKVSGATPGKSHTTSEKEAGLPAGSEASCGAVAATQLAHKYRSAAQRRSKSMMTPLNQVTALLTVINKQKRRNFKVTLCEFTSHLLLLMFLVYGFSLSKIVVFSNRKYDTIALNIPPNFVIEKNRISNIETFNGVYLGDDLYISTYKAISYWYSVLRGPLQIPSFDTYVTAAQTLTRIVARSESVDMLLQSRLGNRYYNILRFGELHFAPYPNTVVDALINYMNATTSTFSTMNIHRHSSERAAVDYILGPGNAQRTFALIVMRQTDAIRSGKVNFVIRMNYTAMQNTNLVIDSSLGRSFNNRFQSYFLSGHNTLSNTIDQFIWNYTNPNTNNGVATSYNGEDACSNVAPPVMDAWFIPFPTYKYNQNPFYVQVQGLLGVAVTMTILYPMSRLVKMLVEDKESKMRELMLIAGLSPVAYNIAHLLSAFVLFLWIAITCTMVCGGSFFGQSNSILLFAYFFLFGMSIISFSFMCSTFFNNAKLAAIAAPVLLFVCILPRYIFFGFNNNEGTSAKVVVSLLSPSAYTFGADIIAQYEYEGVGLQWSNVGNGQYSFSTCLGMLFVDCIIYSLLFAYFNNVLPKDYGSPLHPLFFLFPSYWAPSRYGRSGDSAVTDARIDMAINDGTTVERLSESEISNVRVTIDGLTKIYGDGKVAVNNLSLQLLAGQVTCLLGANGSGKTTTMSVLTGMISPTYGNVTIFGCNLTTQMSLIRQMTGLCPQQNVLYPQITVCEHLHLFAAIKGLCCGEVSEAADRVLKEVGLYDKRSALSSSLSGGMKRKLQLAIALLDDPKFLLLDEPTSGLDTNSRRFIWSLIQRHKAGGGVVVISTHYMFEADYLGDRIAIMSDGRLACAGTGLFLKSALGKGYILSLSRDIGNDSSGNLCGYGENREIADFVYSNISTATAATAAGGEMTFNLPLNRLADIPHLLSSLHENKSRFGIGSFGIALSSLEQVFVAVADRMDKASSLPGGAALIADQPLHRRLLTAISSSLAPFFVTTSNVAANSNGNGDGDGVGLYADSDGDTVEMVKCGHVAVDIGGATKKEVDIKESNNAISVATSNDAVDVDNDADGGDDDEMVYPKDHSLGRIIYLLMFKRAMSLRRDIKGFVFQVLFPAGQILLILAILTIDLNPTGHTMTMDTQNFVSTKYIRSPLRPSVIGANTAASDLFPYMSKTRMVFSSIGSDGSATSTFGPGDTNRTVDSSVISNILLDTYNTPHRDRYGAYVFNDSIALNVSVDWGWVRRHLPFILENQQTIYSLTGLSLFGASATSTTIPAGTIQSILTDQFIGFINGIANTTILSLNSTTVKFFNQTLTINNVTIPVALIAAALPVGLKNYTLSIGSAYTVMHNSTCIHGVSYFRSELMASALLKCRYNSDALAKTANGNGYDGFYLNKNHPLPLTSQQTLENKLILSLLASIFILIPLCYIPASFVSFIVKERETKAKHLQFISSVSPNLYWLATYLWDLGLFLVLIIFILISFYIYGRDAAVIFISNSESTSAIFALLLSYGMSVLPLCYLYSNMFTSHSTAIISVTAINFFTGFVAVLGYNIMQNIELTKDLSVELRKFFVLFPPYNVGEGLIAVSVNYYSNYFRGSRRYVSYFEWKVCLQNIVFMLIEAAVFLLLQLMQEVSLDQYMFLYAPKRLYRAYKLFNTYIYRLNSFVNADPRGDGSADVVLDDDVQREKDIVDSYFNTQKMDYKGRLATYATDDLSSCEFLVLVDDLIKIYNPLSSFVSASSRKVAVRNVSFAIRPGEVFGLLGQNGAGKSTTFGVLTGDMPPTAGGVYVNGYSVLDPRARQCVGYCAQTDPLFELLNAYETLLFYGGIRGIAEPVLSRRARRLVAEVGLTKHAHRPCGTYSGGNKRKLSLAIALIGTPKVLFLDEPSSGMDPYAARKMWRVINSLTSPTRPGGGLTVILTTHSMEECEALCSRITILKAGSAQCIGSIQHLKSRFGSGYQLELRYDPATSDEACREAEEAIVRRFKVLQVVERRHKYCRMVGDISGDLGSALGFVEDNKSNFGIMDYNLSQFPLEQLFNQFSDGHNNTDDQYIDPPDDKGGAMSSNMYKARQVEREEKNDFVDAI